MAKVTTLDLATGKRRPPEFEQATERGRENRREWETVSLYPGYRYAAFEGYGCALTESACSLLYAMPAEERRRLLEAWFAPGGIGALVHLRANGEVFTFTLPERSFTSVII